MGKIVHNGVTYAGNDNEVTQTATNDNNNYEVLLSSTADNITRTEGAKKNSNLTFNPSTGNLQATQLNGVTIGNSPEFTDTTYSSEPAASGGTDVSLCTTGEKYTWNNKSDVGELNDLSDVSITSESLSNFPFLKYDSTTENWKNSTIMTSNLYDWGGASVGQFVKYGNTGTYVGANIDYSDVQNRPTNQSASSGGTTVSLCTTGEKYNWNRVTSVLPGYKVRVVTKDFSSLAITSSAGSVYVCSNQTLTVATSNLGNMSTLTAVFGTVYLTSGTTATWVGVQSAYISNSNLIINYVVYRHTSNTLSNVRVRFLVIGT